MDKNHENFIGVYEGALSDQWCDSVIDWYNKLESQVPEIITDRKKQKHRNPLTSTNSFIFLDQHLPKLNGNELYSYFMQVLTKDIFPAYLEKYFSTELSQAIPYSVKVQKTLPEEGYHTFHNETDCFQCGNRLLVYMVYLNDIEEGGETEFLYQRRRIRPKKGTMVLFPPYYTHIHRGNPPLNSTKYAITGWMEKSFTQAK